MTTDTPAAAPITAPREQFQEAVMCFRKAAYEFGMADDPADHETMLLWQRRIFALYDLTAGKPSVSAPVAAQPSASGVPIQLGRAAFRFTSFQQWVDKAQSWFRTRMPKRAREGKRYLCIDAVGRVCLVGTDFMRARDEGTFPIVVYLIDSDTPAVSTALTGAAKEVK